MAGAEGLASGPGRSSSARGEKGGCPRPWKKKAPWEPLRTHRRIEGEVARRSQGQRSALREDPGGGREQEGAMAAGSACALEEGEGVLCARLKEKRGRNGCGG
jgi:hypothetical protein